MAVTITRAAGGVGYLDMTIVNAGSAPTPMTIEMNTEQDFASSDTLLFPLIATPGPDPLSFGIPGLPNATPFWIRARVNGETAYSNVMLAATPPVPPAAYGGFSIDKAIIVPQSPLYDVANFNAPGTEPMAGFPVGNLMRDDPLSTWQMMNPAGPIVAQINFRTSGEPIDTVALLGTTAGDDATYVLHHSTDGAFNTPSDTIISGTFRCSPTVGRRRSYHSLIQLPAPTTDTYWALQIQTPARHFLARNLVVGLARQSINASKGAGATPTDMGSAARTRFGTIDRVSGWRGRSVDFSLGWLSEAEYHAKFADLGGLVGKTESVLAVHNSKANVHLNDRIAFGPITDSREETLSARRLSKTFTIDSSY